MKLSLRYAVTFLLCAGLLSAVLGNDTALAGGFQLTVEAPAADSQVWDAVLLVRTFGCHTPADANVAGSAEGLVHGVRKSIRLNLRPTSTGVYAVTREWPAEGKWILSFSGAYNGMTCTVLVELGESGQVRPGTTIAAGARKGTYARAVRRKLTAREIDEALNGSVSSIGESTSSGAGSGWPAAGAGAALSLAGLFILNRRRHFGVSKNKRRNNDG